MPLTYTSSCHIWLRIHNSMSVPGSLLSTQLQMPSLKELHILTMLKYNHLLQNVTTSFYTTTFFTLTSWGNKAK